MRRYTKHSLAQVIALSPRQIFSRVGLVLLVLACVVLMIASKASPSFRENISAPVADSVSPVLDVLSRPSEAVGHFTGWLQNMAGVYAQNQLLRESNARLMQWQQVALQLEAENIALRELLHYSADEQLKFTTAKVITDRSGPFSRTVLINAGAKLGIANGQPIVNADGMVGRILETGEHSARVLLLTDINSRVPVISEQSRERSIAAGNNTEDLSLLYLADDTKIKIGEKLLTSGDGNTVPAGLPLGEVTAIEKGVVKVRPFANWYHLEYVSAIKHDAPLP